MPLTVDIVIVEPKFTFPTMVCFRNDNYSYVFEGTSTMDSQGQNANFLGHCSKRRPMAAR